MRILGYFALLLAIFITSVVTISLVGYVASLVDAYGNHLVIRPKTKPTITPSPRPTLDISPEGIETQEPGQQTFVCIGRKGAKIYNDENKATDGLLQPGSCYQLLDAIATGKEWMYKIDDDKWVRGAPYVTYLVQALDVKKWLDWFAQLP